MPISKMKQIEIDDYVHWLLYAVYNIFDDVVTNVVSFHGNFIVFHIII